MGVWNRTMDGGEAYHLDYLVEENVTAGQGLVMTATQTDVGEAEDPSAVTAATNFVGCASHDATFNATPTADPISIGHSPENLARVIVNPLVIWRFKIAGGTASGTALQPATATTANILSNDTADLTTPDTVTDTAVGTSTAGDFTGGLIKGRTGNNVGAIRRLNAHTSGVSVAVGIDFINGLAAGDTFIRVPFSRSVINMQFTTDFVEANGLVNTGTGAPFSVVNVVIDELDDEAWVDVVARYHAFSPTA